jgi:mRNA interferase MazF
VTSRARGLSSEAPIGPANGLDQEWVLSCDNVVTISVDSLGWLVGHLVPEQEAGLSRAVRVASDLDEPASEHPVFPDRHSKSPGRDT